MKLRVQDCAPKVTTLCDSVRQKYDKYPEYASSPETLSFLSNIPKLVFDNVTDTDTLGSWALQERYLKECLLPIRDLALTRMSAVNDANAGRSPLDVESFEARYRTIRTAALGIGTWGGAQDSADVIWGLYTGNKVHIERAAFEQKPQIKLPEGLPARFFSDLGDLLTKSITDVNEHFQLQKPKSSAPEAPAHGSTTAPSPSPATAATLGLGAPIADQAKSSR